MKTIRDCQGKGQDDSFGDVGMRNLDQWELTRLIQSFICIVYYSLISEMENWCEISLLEIRMCENLLEVRR